MKACDKIIQNNEKIKLFSELYADIIESEIMSDKELEIAKAKAKVARDEMLKLNFHNSKLISSIYFGCTDKND